MSAIISGRVWQLALPQSQKLVLLCYADHCDHLGCNAYPSIPLVAAKTGYSEDQTRRIVQDLVKAGLMSPEGHTKGGRGRPTRYTLYPEKGCVHRFFQEPQQAPKEAEEGVNPGIDASVFPPEEPENPGIDAGVYNPGTPENPGTNGVNPGIDGLNPGTAMPGEPNNQLTVINTLRVALDAGAKFGKGQGDLTGGSVIAYVQAAYKSKHGERAYLTNPQTAQLIAACKEMRSRFCDALEAYLMSSDRFVVKNNHDIATFLMSPQRYAPKAAVEGAEAGEPKYLDW